MNELGEEIPADPHGNNLAISCPSCGHPLLLIAFDNQRGSDENHPATCKACKQKFFLDVRERAEKLYVLSL